MIGSVVGYVNLSAPTFGLDDFGVTLLDVGRVLAELYLTPLMPEGNKGCLSLGLSLSGKPSAYLRAPLDGVVYNVMLKDGLFVMWMTPEARAE